MYNLWILDEGHYQCFFVKNSAQWNSEKGPWNEGHLFLLDANTFCTVQPLDKWCFWVNHTFNVSKVSCIQSFTGVYIIILAIYIPHSIYACPQIRTFHFILHCLCVRNIIIYLLLKLLCFSQHNGKVQVCVSLVVWLYNHTLTAIINTPSLPSIGPTRHVPSQHSGSPDSSFLPPSPTSWSLHYLPRLPQPEQYGWDWHW